MRALRVTEEVGDAAALDLARYIRPGAMVTWGQGCAEPLTLTEALSEAGLLDIVPCHYSQLPDLLGRGPLRVNVLFLTLPPAGLARADAGVIVTEYGVADLRGLSLARRRERMIAIAHPDHREALEAAAGDRTEDQA